MSFIIGHILKLLRNIDPGIRFLHLQRSTNTSLYTFPDIALIVDQFHLSPIILHQLPAFLTDRIRHNDHCMVSPDRTNKRKPNPLISTGRFHNNRILLNLPLLFRIQNHIPGRSRLHRTANIQRLKLHQNLCTVFICHPVQPNHRRISHCLKYIIIYHFNCSSTKPLS